MLKRIFVISGIPGSGKSTLANKIWRLSPLNSVIVSNDSIRKMISGFSDIGVNETYHISKEVTERLKDLILLTRENLISFYLNLSGIETIIIDACFFTKRSVEQLEYFKQKGIADVIFCFLPCDIDVAIQRASQRPRKEDEKTIHFIDQKLKEFDLNYDCVGLEEIIKKATSS